MTPNIIFMHSHNTGTYVQPYGHAVPTPNIQRLAEQGVLFRKAFAAAPTCSPSRASFLSGQYPHCCGMHGLGHRGFRMRDYSQHIVHTLKEAGYLTVLAGVEHTAPDLAMVGYDRTLSEDDTNYPETQEHGPGAAVAAVAFLDSGPDRPFFLSLGLNETHRPFPDPDPVEHPAEDARYCSAPGVLPDTPVTRADFAAFKASARVMDDAFGQVLEALDRSGLADTTFVFCFSDHGLQFPRHMCNLTDSGLGVYLIVRGPAGFEGGKVVDQMVSLTDLVPTVYDVAGIDGPSCVQGQSLVPVVNGECENLHDEIFGEINYHAAYEPTRCIRTYRYKYIRRFDERGKLVLPNADDTPSKAFLLTHDWTALPRDQEMLFDLVFDPSESNNLAGCPEQQDTLNDMRARLETWMRESNDPLLAGSVPAPSGASVNDPDGQSPREPPMVL